jgi:mRNA-degrading endonuclease RelE of RelBE toxin-antitoxin system
MDEREIIIQVDATAKFQKKIKSLAKKYRNIQDDIIPIIRSIERGELPGDRIIGLNLEIYKVRVKNSNNQKGKSSGYRLIYYVKTIDRVILVTIYVKSEQEDIDGNEIDSIISEFEHQDKIDSQTIENKDDISN